METVSPVIYKVWNEYLAAIKADSYIDMPFIDKFGNDKQLCNKLFNAVVTGRKSASTGCLYSMISQNERMIGEGEITILTNWDQTEACILRTRSVKRKPFSEITEDEARLEGAGDFSLDYWRKVHSEYFSAELQELGKVFDDNTMVVFEQFDMIFR